MSPLARPLHAASIFQAGRPRLTDEDLTTRDSVILSAYGSTREAALLSLRAALQAAVGAVEMEIHTVRKNRITVQDIARYVADAPEDDEDEVEDDDDDDTRPVVIFTADPDDDTDGD